jgi:DNA helicase-2/ATP-dependent DNA helicase PcrA
MEEERRLAYVGMTRARHRLYLSHAWQRATRRGPGTSWMAEPSRFLLEIPQELMSGPRLGARTEDGDTYDAPDDLNLVFGRGATRFGRAIRPGGGAFREGSGRPGAPRDGEPFRPSRDLAARRDAFAGGARSGTFGSTFAQRRAAQAWDEEHDGAAPHPEDGPGATAAGKPAGSDRPVIPGERRYRDGDRVRHARWGDGIVVSSKLTRSDEEVTIAFRDPQVGRKTLLASLAGLELTG